jgi:hypothetical protein
MILVNCDAFSSSASRKSGAGACFSWRLCVSVRDVRPHERIPGEGVVAPREVLRGRSVQVLPESGEDLPQF